MHDMKVIRDDPKGFDADLARRFLPPRAPGAVHIDRQRRAELAVRETIQARRNEIAKEIGRLKRIGGETAMLQAEAAEVNEKLDSVARVLPLHEEELRTLLESLPNRLDPDVPDGRDDSSNHLKHGWGSRRHPEFPPKQHFELGEALGMMDSEAATRISGARFTVLRGPLARLERALGQFMIDLHISAHGYAEIGVPSLVNDATLYGTGQLPKFAEDCFRTTDGRWLIPTAEVPLTNLVAGQIVPAAKLPMRLTALTDCYRSEAGSAGRDTRGMLRQHQFRKVELVSLVAPEDSDIEHERMTRCAETVLEKLGLPYRRMLLCAGDTGFSAAKTYDLEVWLPGQGAWREISSCSNCRDFQARRMNARMRSPDGKGTRMLHTLNGSGVAVGRALIAVMENDQQADGSIVVPDVLRPYMAGLEVIRAA